MRFSFSLILFFGFLCLFLFFSHQPHFVSTGYIL